MNNILNDSAIDELLPGICCGELELPGSVVPDFPDRAIVLNYCRSGRLGIKTGGQSVFLAQGDFCVFSAELLRGAELSLPSGGYAGLVIAINMDEVEKSPPDAFAGSDYIIKTLRDKLCGGSFTAQAGNEQTENIFSGFFAQPAPMQLAYRRLKALELLLYLARLEPGNQNPLTEYQAEQLRVIRAVHDLLEANMDRRYTIEELSRQYHMNPTTLKTLFKSVYGSSLAAHIKEHRMERAAELLRESDMSVAEIANQVGYESQSRFSAAFKEYYGQLPKEYRK